MTKAEKLIERFKKKPKDFSYNELKRLLNSLGYTEKQGTGSRVVFNCQNIGHKIKLHKPHPGTILKRYQLDLVENELKKNGIL